MEKDYIMTSIKPFVMKQEVSVFLNDNCVETIYCTIDDMDKILISLADKYNISQINLLEKNDMYSAKIKDCLITKYADKGLDIKIWGYAQKID